MGALNTLSAVEAARQIAAKKITSEALVRDCLERIEARESEVQAWVHIAADAALTQARAADAGPNRGLLHGVPIGVKDLIDTVDMPTTSAPMPLRKRYSARVSRLGPETATKTPL